MAEAEMAEASAEMFAEMAEIPNPLELDPTELGQIMVNKMFDQAVAPLDKLTDQKGKVGLSEFSFQKKHTLANSRSLLYRVTPRVPLIVLPSLL
jgi:hypothetical protein